MVPHRSLLTRFHSPLRRLLAAVLWLPVLAFAAAGVPTLQLPIATEAGVFRFSFAVEAGETYFIDPDVAIGYTYAIGQGDPLFRSVTLPAEIGDGRYDLFLFDAAGVPTPFAAGVAGGVAVDFGPVGVDRFRVTGIEASAGLDPADPTAFVTALGFAGAGHFTGTQAPLTVAVSEPALGTLLMLGMGLLALSRRRLGTGGRRQARRWPLTKALFRSRL